MVHITHKCTHFFTTLAIDTLVAQAFTGAKNAYTIGVILQRGLIIIYIFGAAIALLWTWAEDILLYMGQQPELARKAQEYITVFTPNLFIIFTTTALRKFLQGLGEMKVTMYLVFVVFPINAALDYFFIMYLGLGYVGAAYQSIVYFIITLTFYVLFTIYCTDAKKYWPGLTTQAFSRWGEFLKLGKVLENALEAYHTQPQIRYPGYVERVYRLGI